MSEKTIIMSYHSALKKIKFENERGEDISPKYAPLEKWTQRSIVLQEQGDDFFGDLIDATDGVQVLKIVFNGTEVDFEDFSSMAEYYNNKNSRRIECIRGKKLPDMNIMFKEIEKLGNASVDILKKKTYEIPHSSVTYEVEEELKEKLQDHIDRISNKIDKLSSSNINICFVGTYSSGKSSLINAILRERILPEADESKTAKFFVISDPIDGKYGIEFGINGIKTLIDWNGSFLQLDDNCASHEFRKTIQESIDKHCHEHRSSQFCNILNLLNDNEEVDIEIRVFYNIPINSDESKFTIYDTPGTGSNTTEHKKILERALEDQENSIVVFVGAVTKLEGEGNSELLKLLNNDNNSRIDLDRSLFVINRSDTTTKPNLKKYCDEKIKLTDTDKNETERLVEIVEISLKDKKLFFTSAAQASAAMAYKINIQTEDDEEYYESIKSYGFYEFDRYGNSEMATDRIKNAALKAENQADNEYDKAYIKVGLYSLVEAIKEYGRKYALAVKVNALIAAVDDSLDSLLDFSGVLESICNGKIDDFNKDLERISSEINGKIESFHNVNTIKGGDIPEEIRKELRVDANSQTDFDQKITKALVTLLKSGKKHNREKKNVNAKYIESDKIYEKLSKLMSDFYALFDKNMKKILEKKKEFFIQEIERIINSDEQLSETAKKRLLYGLDRNTDLSDILRTLNFSKIVEVIKDNTKSKKFLFWDWEIVDAYEVRKEINSYIKEINAENSDVFSNHFNSNYTKLLDTIYTNFKENVDDFSAEIKGVKENLDHMNKIICAITCTTHELEEQKNDLDRTAWRVE